MTEPLKGHSLFLLLRCRFSLVKHSVMYSPQINSVCKAGFMGGCNSEYRKCLLSALTAVHIRLVSFRKNALSYGQDKQNCLLYNDCLYYNVSGCPWRIVSLYYRIVYSDWQWPMFHSPSMNFLWNTPCLPHSPQPKIERLIA